MASYSISKCIRTDKPEKRNGKYPIYFRITFSNKETKIPSDIDINKDNWDTKKKEPKDKILANLLNKKKTELERFLNLALADNQELTIDFVKSFNSGKKKIKPEDTSFYEYYLNFVERKRKEGLSPRTLLIYTSTYNSLKLYKPVFHISEINLSLIESFDIYLRDEMGNADGGRYPKHQNIRTIILDMLKHDIQIKNPYLFFKIPKAKTKEVYLNKVELEAMRSLRNKLIHSTTLYKALQMFLFSCYCGLRYSDIAELKWSHLNEKKTIITKIMRKTSTVVKAPIFKMANIVLLELSDGKKLFGSDNLVFGKYSYPTINNSLVELTEMAKIKKHITFHSARHTFATLLQKDGTPLPTIQRYLGHKSITTTERYLKYDLKIAEESMNNISTFG